MKVKLANVRLAFPNLHEATKVNGEGEEAFSASFLFPPGHPAEKEVNAAIDAVAKEKWGPKAPDILKQLRAGDKTCLHKGDTKAQYDGFPGNLFVATRSKVRPTVIDRNRSPLTASDGKPYAGCYVVAIIALWAQDNRFGKRVNAQLTGVQFMSDGDAFGGGVAAADADDFDELAVPEEAADLV